MSFLAPTFFFLVPLALLPWVGPFATPNRGHALIRSLVFLLVIGALARPVREVVDPTIHRVVILDRSRSISDEADRAGVSWLQGAVAVAEADAWTVIQVGGAGRESFELPGGVRRLSLESEGDSPLGVALDAAARALPSAARRAGVVLVSDGAATEPENGAAWLRALADLQERGVPVDWLQVRGVDGDLRVFGLDDHGPVRAGRETMLLAQLSGGGQVVDCVLSGPQGELARTENVRIDGQAAVPLEFVPEAPGFLDLTLAVTVKDGVDPRGGDLEYARTLCVEDPLRMLYLGRRVTNARDRLADLVGGGFELVEESGLQRVDLVMLDDRPASEVPAAFQQELVERVREGGVGLLAAGGEASFGPGGYHEEPIEELLPVEFVQKEEKRDPSTTLVVIIDTSGSMGGNRVQLAKEVARLAIRRLLPHDKVGLVEFYGAKRWAVPIQPASNSIEIERALNRLDAGGGTVILPAIEEAYYGLKNVRTRYKHVLILTDGGVETGAFEPLLRRMADDGMNVSTVLIGPDAHSEFLVNIANWGQGRFYSVPNRFNLPEILLKQPASAKLPAYRPGIVNVRAHGGDSWWGEVDPTSTPPIAGYVETRLRPGAERVLETAEESHPVMASWRYGLGRVTALTTEPTGPGTESWSDWEGYGEWLSRALERTAADDAAPFTFELSHVPGGASLVAEARRALPAGSRPLANRVDLDSGLDPITFECVAPGRFEALLRFDAGSSLRVECGAEIGGKAPASLRSTRLVLDPSAGRELQVAPLLGERLASSLLETGGTVNDLAAATAGGMTTSEAAGVERTRLRELSPLLALLALLLYLFDLAYRRWPRPTNLA